MTPPRNYSADIELARKGYWAKLLDDEALIRTTLIAKASLRRKGLLPNLRPLIEAKYQTGIAACEARGLGRLAGMWFRPRDGVVFSLDVRVTDSGVAFERKRATTPNSRGRFRWEAAG